MVLGRRRRGERGAAAVEFALIMPIFLMLLFGIIDFGYMINRASIINNAARDGARAVALVNGSQEDGEYAAKQSLDAVPDATVTVSCVAESGPCNMSDRGQAENAVKPAVRVTVNYRHKMLTPVGIFVPGGFDLSRTAEMRFEQ